MQTVAFDLMQRLWQVQEALHWLGYLVGALVIFSAVQTFLLWWLCSTIRFTSSERKEEE